MVIEEPGTVVDEDCADGSDRRASCPSVESGMQSETTSDTGSEDRSRATDVIKVAEDARRVSQS
jgi:hypothetical protein